VFNKPIFTISPIVRGPEPTPTLPEGRKAQAWHAIRSAVNRVQTATSTQLVNVIAVAALLIVISHATFITSNDMLARYSGVLSDLSLVLLAAWIFNLLVVEIPRRQDRVRLYSGITSARGAANTATALR
jgi:hypothetical protein